ncbi:hypothetical protein [Sphingobium sp. D43FB]|uniref:hypothetical protein n=1 Tax=Sphingobium sp. D43FB TaxID=2017595 RepID=UPI000BB55396|nr:hypothetical protein [Sphingobium sp. D43FB]PBN42974.1 hypothetical protein SxD43FB_14185 [Sphingobium sp. D43FB]
MREEILVENPHGNDLEFEGELLIDESHFDVGFVKVWRTLGGRYVLRQTRSSRPGFRDIDRVEKFDTAQKLSEALGHSRGAKEISRKLGLSRTDRID